MAPEGEGNGRTAQARTAVPAENASANAKMELFLQRVTNRVGNENAIRAEMMGGIAMPIRERKQVQFLQEAGVESAEMLDEQPVREEARSANLGKMFKSIAKLYKEMDKPIGALLDEAVLIFKEAAGVSDDSVFMVYLRESSMHAAGIEGDGFSVISLKSGDESLAGIAPELMKELRIEDAAGSGKIAQFTMSTDQAGGMMLTPAVEGSPSAMLTRLLNSKITGKEPGLGGLNLVETFPIANGKLHGGLMVLARNGSKLTAEQAQILEGLSDVVGELIGLKNEREGMEARFGEQKKMLGDVERIISSKRNIPKEIIEKMNGNMGAASVYKLLQSAGEIMGGELGAVSTFSTSQGKEDVMLAPDMVVRNDGEIAEGIRQMSVYSRGVLPTLARVAMQEGEAICISSKKSSVVFTVNEATGEFARFGTVDGGNPWRPGKGGDGIAKEETAAISYAVKGKDGEVRVFSFPIFKEVQVTEKTTVREIARENGSVQKEFLEAMQIVVNGRREFGLNDLRRIRLACSQMASEITLEMQAGKTYTDGLTGLFNRPYFMQALLTEVRKARRGDGEYRFGVIFTDVDNFKGVNDTHGHQTGDAVLKALAGVLEENVRNTDIVCRYGGEEFIGLLDGSGKRGFDADALKSRSEAIRRGMAARKFDVSGEGDFSVTLSIGAVMVSINRNDPRSDEEIVQEVIKIADKAMYAAKGKEKFIQGCRVVGFEGPVKNRIFFVDFRTADEMEKVGVETARKSGLRALNGGKKEKAGISPRKVAEASA